LREGAIDPAVRVLPVTGNCVPQYAGHPLLCQHLNYHRIEQPLIQIAALPEWAEEAVRGSNELLHQRCWWRFRRVCW
jgi:hypothetical protein